jgi:hypothetical protein
VASPSSVAVSSYRTLTARPRDNRRVYERFLLRTITPGAAAAGRRRFGVTGVPEEVLFAGAVATLGQ